MASRCVRLNVSLEGYWSKAACSSSEVPHHLLEPIVSVNGSAQQNLPEAEALTFCSGLMLITVKLERQIKVVQ